MSEHDHSQQKPRPNEDQPQRDNSPFGKLKTQLGFDPTRPAKLSQVLMAEVIADLRKGKIEEAKKKATELLTKAIDLSEKKAQADRAYRKAGQAFDKELGKVIQQINSVLEGATELPDEADEPDTSK